MPRVAKVEIALPKEVHLRHEQGVIHVEGPKGKLSQRISLDLKVDLKQGVVALERPTNQKRHKAEHGLYCALIKNMVVGVSQGYTKELELVGVGYRASHQGQILELSLGYSHPIFMQIPEEISVHTEVPKGRGSGNPLIRLSGIDKQLVGAVAAKVCALRKTEPYKGKGVRYLGQDVRRKAGKTAAKK